MNWNEFQKWCAALCAWREARGEGRDGIRAVLHVIANRALAQSKSWAEIIYAPLQFSSMTYAHDPQLSNVPKFPDAVFTDCFEIADLVYQGKDFDLTNGATHYFANSITPPLWAAAMKQTAQVGRQTFFKSEVV
jgi:spore germination cell wall hydrolase CwlJ-like protein